MTAREVMRLIERNGWILLRQRGSHCQYEARVILADGTEITARTTVAQHAGDVRPGTLRAIERDLEPVFGKGMAEEAMKYHVVVTRDGDRWMADVPALPGTHTWAKTLRALDRNVREVIGMVEDLPRSAEAAMDLDMEYHTGDSVLDERAGTLRTRRREQERAATEIASETSELLRRFAAELSVGDAAVLLGVSKGRISQLRSGSAGQPTAAGRRTGTDG
jgi:predicted RNA binding protein YcfA (HicA-like mRNA interferase family)/predicted RNase H-like HicB family nuclease